MADSMYPGMDEDEANPSMTGEHDESMPHKDKDEEGETALLPKSMFGGKDPKPGEEYVFEVVRGYEDEIEIKYSTKPEKEESEDQHSEANGKLDSMGVEMGNPTPGY